MIAREFDGTSLSTICDISKANAFDGDIIALDGQNPIADRSLDSHLSTANILIIAAPYIEAFSVKIDIESSPRELIKIKNLPECVAVDKNLLGPNRDLEVDGGIDAQTAPAVVEAGANVLVAGSYIFKSPSYLEAIETLRQTG